MWNHLFKVFVSGLVIIGIGACSHQEIFFRYQSFSNAGWERDNPAIFNVGIDDHLQPYDLTIEIRNNDRYPYNNIWLLIDYKTPEGSSAIDSIRADLADADGKWLGKGFSVYNLSVPYQSSVLFPDTGIYVYSIYHGMQENRLKGISDIGLKVSKKSVE